MDTFLSVDLTSFPFGWEKLYNDALRDYPYGKNFAGLWNMPAIGIYETQVDAYRTDPVGFRAFLVREYRKHQSRALSIAQSYHQSNDHSCVGKLIREDMILYNLAAEWCTDYRSADAPYHHCNTEEFLASGILEKPSLAYFAEHDVDPWKLLSQYRVVNWFLDYSEFRHT